MNNTVQYFSTLKDFLCKTEQEITGLVYTNEQFGTTIETKEAWLAEIRILKEQLKGFSEEENTHVFFEYNIPRVSGRIDCGIIIKNILFILEFKTGESQTEKQAYKNQLESYVRNLKNYHFESYDIPLVPILVVEGIDNSECKIQDMTPGNYLAINVVNENRIAEVLEIALRSIKNEASLNAEQWIKSPYCPTTNIVDAARKLFNNHSVKDIERTDENGENLTRTTKRLLDIIHDAKTNNKKVLCMLTGVPGAGKTLIGLSVAGEYRKEDTTNKPVYLSGNHPLVTVLQEALVRDAHAKELDSYEKRKESGMLKLNETKPTKGSIFSTVEKFIQLIYKWRAYHLEGIKVIGDDIVRDEAYYKGKEDRYKPYDHVAIFDEAQRTWNKEEHSRFIRNHGKSDFPEWSEARFLLSCMDRHDDWAVVVCLVGNGQDINRGEAGIGDWIESISLPCFKHWHVHAPEEFTKHVGCEKVTNFHLEKELHLGVSLRSLREENISRFVDALLDRDTETAKSLYESFKDRYPIILTRDINNAKEWLRLKGIKHENSRYGIVASSKAQRLKPLAIDVSHSQSMNVKAWFLNGKEDVHSSYYMEDIATEFQIQGLEIDWACVAWDGDLLYNMDTKDWNHRQFKTCGWQNIIKEHLKNYHLNAYRVLLTRARRGMIICVPEGDAIDKTRWPENYNSTFIYLNEMIGIPAI